MGGFTGGWKVGVGCAIVAPARFALQSLIHLRRSTGHAMLLAEGRQVPDVVGEVEIIAAIAACNRGE